MIYILVNNNFKYTLYNKNNHYKISFGNLITRIKVFIMNFFKYDLNPFAYNGYLPNDNTGAIKRLLNAKKNFFRLLFILYFWIA